MQSKDKDKSLQFGLRQDQRTLKQYQNNRFQTSMDEP